MSDPNPHPTQEQLLAFAAGRLTGPEADAVEEHVAGCAACVSAVPELPDEPLISLARSSLKGRAG